MKHKFLNILLAFAILTFPSAVFAEINTDDWELAAYYDFTKNVNSGFKTINLNTITDGEGILDWNTTITTEKSYEGAIFDFDYRVHTAEANRVTVNFGDNNFSYMDFTNNGGGSHFVANGGDDVYKNGTEFLFKLNTAYSMHFVVSNDTVEFYAKETDDEDYTFLGERTGLAIGKFTIGIKNWGGGYVKNLKVYALPKLSVEIACGDNGFIDTEDDIKLNFSKAIDEYDAQEKIKLTHDGNEIPFTVALDGDACKIVPVGGFAPQRQYNILVESGLSSGQLVLEEDACFTVNTKPVVTVAEDFDEDNNDNFTKTYATTENGRVWLGNGGNITSVKEFSDYIAEFDYIQENENTDGRIMIYPRVDVNNFSYIIMDNAGGVHIVDDDGDSAVNSEMIFSPNEQYSFRIVVTKTRYDIYAAKNGGSYVYLNGNEISGSSGKIKLTNLGNAYIDNVRIYEYDDNVTTDPKDILARKDSAFDLHFASDMNDETINADNIKLSDETKDYSLNIERKSANTYKITLNEWLEYGKEYSLSLSEDVKSLFGTSPDAGYAITLKTVDVPNAVSIENVKFNGDEYSETALESSCRVTAEAAYNFTEGSLTAVCACVVYDEDENGSKMLMSKWLPINLSAADPLQNLTFDINASDIDSPTVRIFVWDSLASAEFLAEPAVRGE